MSAKSWPGGGEGEATHRRVCTPSTALLWAALPLLVAAYVIWRLIP